MRDSDPTSSPSPPPTPEPTDPTNSSPSAPARRDRGDLRRALVRSSVALVAVVVVSAGLVAARRIDGPVPQPTVGASQLATSVVAGSAPNLPWPAAGQGAVAIPGLGYAAQSGPEQPVPIASVTKMTTAVVVLHDHPIAPGTSGPTLTITPDDAAQFGVNLANGETNIPLVPGETLTELQLLEATLIRSADDAAYTLAVWDAGSLPAFLAKMNALAVSLGALHSHYVDASGFDPQSVSTAADTLRIAAAGMAIPVFASVADMPSVTLPGAGLVENIVSKIGTDGIVGVKSGYTSQASGCMVLAGYRFVRGRSVLVLASVLGQREPPPAPPSPVPTAAPAAPYSALEAQYPLLYTEPIVEHLLDTSIAAIVPVPLLSAGQSVGSAGVDGDGARRVVPVVAARGAWLLGVPGQKVTAAMTPSTPQTDGVSTGVVRFTLGPQSETVPVRVAHGVPDPGWWWKLVHN